MDDSSLQSLRAGLAASVGRPVGNTVSYSRYTVVRVEQRVLIDL